MRDEADGGCFHVVYPRKILDWFDDFYRHAKEIGLAHTVYEASKIIADNLVSNPGEFGDPLFRYRFMKGTVYRRVVGPLVVTYAVHDELNIVFVKSIEKMPNAGF